MLIRIEKSRYLAGILLASHLGAIGIAASLPLGPGVCVLLAAAVAASLGWQWKRHGNWQRGEWRLYDDGTCSRLPQADGPPIRYELLQAETGALWVRLRIARHPRERRELFVWKDAVDTETYRELHARIEQRRLPGRDEEISEPKPPPA